MDDSWNPLDFQTVELHDEVVRFEQVNGELRAYLADGSYYEVGTSDAGKLIVHFPHEQRNS